MYSPPNDDLMSVPPAKMYHVPCKDTWQRNYFLRSLERDFRGCERAANVLRKPKNRV